MMVAGGLIWFLGVFLLTFRWTFPSDAIADRVRVEVSNATDGAYDLSMSGVRPWGTGAAAEQVILSEVAPARGAEPGEKTPLFAFETVRVRAGLLSLLRNQPRLSGAVEVGAAEVDFDLTLGMNKRGTELAPRLVNIETEGFPIEDLAGLAGYTVEATGGLDLEVDLKADESMRDAVGDIKISGKDLVLVSLDPELTMGMDLGREIPIDEIELDLDVEDGKATVRRGTIESELADVEVEGDLTLRDDLARSSMNLSITLDLGEELAMFEPFLKDARWQDGDFHYRCSGTLSRATCRSDRERSSSSSRSRRADTPRPERSGSSGLSDEEREERRKAMQERLRQSAERRQADRSGADAREVLEEEGYLEDDEEYEDEVEEEDEELDERELDEDEIFEDEP